MAIYRYPVRLAWTGSGSPGVNVWHVRTVSAADPNSDLDAIGALLETFYGSLQSAMALGYEVKSPEAAVRVDDGSSQLVTPDQWTVTGSTGTDTTAPALACSIGWKTSVATRRGRGRTFLGPFRSDVIQSDGTVSASRLSQMQTAVDTLVSGSALFANGALCIWSELDLVGRDIVSGSIKDRFAVLRSRRD